MGQRAIIDANNNVRIIETGPIGPTGLAASSNEVGHCWLCLPDDLVFPEGYDPVFETTQPQYLKIGQREILLGHGVNGVFDGNTPIDAGSIDDLEVPTHVGPPPTKIIIADNIPGPTRFTTGELLHGPWLIVRDETAGVWMPPVKIGGGASGAYLLDIRSDTASPFPPGWDGSGPPSGWSGEVFELPSGMLSGGLPIQYFPVDFSILPDDKDTLVVLVRNGHWSIVPTAWPDPSRGPWTLNVVFEDFQPESNLIEMGVTITDLLSWGFFPTNTNVTVEYHTGWGG